MNKLQTGAIVMTAAFMAETAPPGNHGTLDMPAADVHCHFVTPGYLALLEKHGARMDEFYPIPAWSPEALAAFLDEAGIGLAVLTSVAPQPHFGDAAESAAASPDIEVERVRLYDLPPFKGCMSCLACKLKGRETGLCAILDGLSDTLRAVNEADGLVIASPIYFSEWTAMTRAFLERLVFPWLHYTDFSCTAPKKMPLAWIYTMNAPASMMPDIRRHLAILEGAVARGVGDPEPAFVETHSTVQVKDYSSYAMDGLQPDAHVAWRAEHWEDDLAKARTAGQAMAEKV